VGLDPVIGLAAVDVRKHHADDSRDTDHETDQIQNVDQLHVTGAGAEPFV